MIRALQAGMSHSFFDQNPLLTEKLWPSRNEQVAVYRATTPDGHVFYRRLRRGLIPELPLVLVIDKQFVRIEKNTSRHRHRNAFARGSLHHWQDGLASHAGCTVGLTNGQVQ